MHEEKAMTHSPPYDLPMVVETDQEIAEEEVYVFPVSFAQQRLWFLDQFEPGSPFYNVPTAVRLSGRLDVVALERTLNEIVRRHESLRTTFTALDGEPMQVISPSLTLPLPIVDLRHLPEAEREAEAMRLAQEEARRPFDLSRGPLLRTTLLWLDEEEYLILLTMHHIICDGWSIGVFIGELTTLYTAFTSGQPSPLPELPIQYADFAVWQREWLQGEVLEEQLAYWKQQLGDDPGILELPTDRPRPPIYTNNGAVLSRKLSKRLADALQALSREEGVTLFMTLLAAFQTLLHRYTGQEKISVGTPIANRNRAEIEGLIGFFVNTLVLRTDLSGNPTFRHLLKRVREVTLGAYAHQDLPFEMLVDALQPERDMSHTPLFQVMFILQNAPVQGQELPGLTLSQVETHPGTSTFDLTLSMAEGPDGLEASVEYNTDLFDAATIRRMLDHFQTLLEAIAADPDRPIAELPLLTEAERRQLLVEWNDTATDHPQDLCVHQLFEAQAERTPDAIAVVLPSMDGGPDARLTYGELNRRANQVAHHLRRLGVGPETVVGICVERSLEMVIGALGVLKAGGAYLPLDPLYPQERLAYMLDDAGVTILLTDSSTLPRLSKMEALRDKATRAEAVEATGDEALRAEGGDPHHSSLITHPSSLTTLTLDDWTLFAHEPTTPPESPVAPTNLAYLIYTSGSTGQSKGVMIEHRSLVNAYRGWEASYQLRSVRTHLQMANFAFDVFSGDLVRALCSGGRLVLCPREWLLDPERLYGLMRREGVECAEFVPAVLRHLIQYLDETGERLDFMRLLICGSDSWYVSEYRRFLRFCGPETRLINSFGLTEATIDSCFFEGSAMDLAGEQVVPIGRPFANVRLYILDDHLQPVPVGVPGELFIGGLGVARGYHNRPELTEEKFIPDPFSDDPNARLYRTGDRARYLPDGNIEFLGRLDYQVKVRGYRIELGEIEATLGRHPAVREAAVVALEVAPGDKRLAAYIVPAGETVPTAGELRRFLQERLPDYMVPSAYVVMDALPLTPNGKVDRQALPEPQWSRRQLAGEYVAPRTPVEEVLAGIWSQVLGVEEVGVHDNFFELGGHSLLATQLVSRVREAFEIELPLRHVFECPTIATLAERIEIIQRTEAGVQAPPIRPVPRDREIPLSFSQQRLWFLDQLEPNSPLYNIPDAVRITGPLDVGVLEQSLNEIVRRHEVLRTTFAAVDGRPIQVIAPELHLPLPVVDLRGLPKARREEEALRLATEEAQRPFDLARGPLLRALLLRLDEEEHIALLTVHHTVSDGWSTGVFMGEMAALYEAFAAGKPSPLPELPIQYADFAVWQREWLQGEVLEAQLAYWKEQLAGLPPILELPTDRPRPAFQTFRGDYQTFTLPEELTQAIKELCQREGVTLFMTLLAAFQTLLSRYSGQDDISVGVPIANRTRAELEGLIGFFVNTLVMRTKLDGNPTFRQVLKRVREVALGAYAHQDLPFEMLVEALQPERDMSHTPLFQVMFVLQNAPAEPLELPGLTLTPVEVDRGTATFDLTLSMTEGPEGLSGSLEYNTDLFDAATIRRMLGHFQTLLEAVVADPDRPIAQLPLLTKPERQQMLVQWNATATDFDHDRCAHHLVEAWAARQPHAIAVTFEDQALSYAELDRRANQLAHHLQKL
ncbi:MAG: amino acid adenylation domain-containing protein, partial [Chloroflexi bacterium]